MTSNLLAMASNLILAIPSNYLQLYVLVTAVYLRSLNRHSS